MPADVFEYIKQEETAYEQPIEPIEGWEWSMKKHIRLSTLYKNSQFSEGNSDADRDDKPFKNIVLPMLQLQYRTEGFDVKDIILYIDDTKAYFKSFLVKKYHDRWASEVELDTFIDEMVESYIDYGGALVKDVNDKKPEVVQLATIAFCDQTNMLKGPLDIKHFYSPDELQEFAALGWGNSANNATVSIQEAIVLAGQSQVPDAQTGKKNKTPGKYIEVHELNGVLPESYINASGDPEKWVRQLQIVLFYTDRDGKRKGVKLFAGKRKKIIFDAILRDKIHGRALGRGGVEELFDPQVWANYSEIVMKGMLEAAAKIVHKTTDQQFKTRNNLDEIENNEILVLDDGKDIEQMDTRPVNLPVFEKKVDEWTQHAQLLSAATDALLGEQPASGTPFALQNLITANSQGLHTYRQGKLSTFMARLYRVWILPWIGRDIVQGVKFLESLSLEELQQVADSLVICQANDIIKEKILSGQPIDPNEVESIKTQIRANFMKGGNKRFLEIFAGEMKDIPISVKVDIAGKQKDLNKVVTELGNIFRQIIANPAILDDPRMANIFNQIIEASGLSPVDFSMALPPKPAAPVPSNVIPTQTAPVPVPAA